MRRAALAIALSLVLPDVGHALGFGLNEKADGGQAGAFLSAAQSARPLALGGAFTAIADDATAPFWNASGLAQIQRYDLVTYYSRLGADAAIGSGAFALPTRKLGTFGFNVVGLRSGSFKGRDALNQDTGEFDNDATAYLFSQGLNLSTIWSAGYTLKMVRQEIASFSDTGYGADVGVMARPHPMWHLGLSLQNFIQPSLKLRSQTERFPTEVRLGGRFDPVSKVTLAADVSLVEKREADLSLGAEWKVSGPLALRIGANDREIGAGVGVTAGDLGLDYAFGFPHASVVREELGSSHRVSFHLRFGSNVMAGSYMDLSRKREEERREIASAELAGDQIKALKSRMKGWDGNLDLETFGLVQSARRSLRQLAFTDPMDSIEAQAYISHFQGKLKESSRLFDRLAELKPKDRRIRRDARIARERAANHPDPVGLAARYERLDLADRRRRERDAAAIARAASEAAEEAAVAGGAGGAREGAVEERGSDDGQRQVAFLPPGAALPPAAPRPPAVRPPQRPPQTPARPAPPEREEAPVQRPSPAAPPRREPVAPPAMEQPSPAPAERPAALPPTATKPPAGPEDRVLPPSDRPEIQEAQRHFRAGDYVTSHIATRKLLEKNPADREAARQQMLTSSVVGAQAALTDPKATVDIPRLSERVDHSLRLFDRGMEFYRGKRREEAVLMFEEAVAACPANFLARDMLSKINQEMFDEKWDGILDDANGVNSER